MIDADGNYWIAPWDAALMALQTMLAGTLLGYGLAELVLQ